MKEKKETNRVCVRFARPEDAAAALDVYAEYIDTPITFEYDLPGEEEFAARIREFSSFYPYLVCEKDGRIAGFAYAHRHAQRAAYQWNAELTIYLGSAISGRGAGKILYRALMEILKRQGIHTVYGVVTAGNERSEALHREMGFRELGVFFKTGYKNGSWLDVVWFEKELLAYEKNPAPPRPIGQAGEEACREILERANRELLAAFS